MNFDGPRTQILTEAIATNETVVVYTVPVGKKFFLIETMLVMDAGATGTGEVEIRSDAGAHIRHVCNINIRENNKGIVPSDHFEPGWPIEMSEGQDISVMSDTASLAAQCDIFGFEVDA